MTMTRADLASYLANVHGALLAEAGVAATDTAGALKEPVDDALLALGTDYADLATATIASADIVGARKLGNLAVLERVYRAVLNRVDIEIDGPETRKRRSQMVGNLKTALDAAKAEAAPYLAVGSSWAGGSLSLDFLEPVEA